MIFQRIGSLLIKEESPSDAARKFINFTISKENGVFASFGALLSKIKSGKINLSGSALGGGR
jgi:ABC-type Fe3+ transport system substrate-binding protein